MRTAAAVGGDAIATVAAGVLPFSILKGTLNPLTSWRLLPDVMCSPFFNG
jgi:hypothetical protein